jgi:hypothetical protein
MSTAAALHPRCRPRLGRAIRLHITYTRHSSSPDGSKVQSPLAVRARGELLPLSELGCGWGVRRRGTTIEPRR